MGWREITKPTRLAGSIFSSRPRNSTVGARVDVVIAFSALWSTEKLGPTRAQDPLKPLLIPHGTWTPSGLAAAHLAFQLTATLDLPFVLHLSLLVPLAFA